MPRVVALLVLVLAALGAGFLLWRASESGDAGSAEIERPGSPPSATSTGADPLRGAADRGGTPSAPARDPSTPPTDRDTSTTRDEALGPPRAVGRVVDSASRPISGATIRLFALAAAPFSARTPAGVEATSREDGSFELAPLPARTAFIAEFSAAGKVTRPANVAPRESGAQDLGTIALVDAIAQTALVVAQNGGAPVASVRAWLSRDPPAPGSVEIVGPDGSPSRPPDATGGADGRVSFDGLDSVTYRFRFAADGFAPQDVRRSFIAARGAPPASWKVEMVRADRSASGRVLGPADRPISGATVMALATSAPADTVFGPHRVTARSGADGAFTLTGLTPSEYEVRASAAGAWQAEPVLLRQESADLVIRMGDGAALTGRVTGPDHRARAARVEIRRDDRFGAPMTVRELQTGDDGRFLAADLEPGRYTVAGARDDLAPTVSAPVDVTPGNRATVDLELAPGASITARAVRGGKPITAVAVLLSSEFSAGLAAAEHDLLSPLHGRRATSGADGALALDAVPDGAFSVRIASADGGARLERGVAIAGGRAVDLGDVDVPAVGDVEGIARDAGGAPLSGAEVVAASDAAGERRRARTDASGRFRFAGLPALDFLFSVTPESSDAREFFVTQTAAVVAPGTTLDVTIERRKRS